MDRRFPGFGVARPDDADPAGQDAGAAQPAAVGAPPPGRVEPRHALLIGNGAYRQAALRNPRRDIRLVGAALAQLGFSVTRIEDADLATLRSAVAEFVITLGESDPDTVALFYFAGHGVQADGINYLIPAHADIPAQRYLAARALALDDVVAMLSKSARRANILVLDACRDGAMTEGHAQGGRGPGGQHGFSGGLASLALPPAGMLVAYSTAAGMAANDGKGANSPYATALVETLPRLLEPGRRLHDIFVETAEKVRDATQGQQAPALFLQGGLPALTLAPQDAARRAAYDPWGPARARRVALRTGGAMLAALLALSVGLIWAFMEPIDKRAWLALAGLADPPGKGLSCSGPPDGAGQDPYGLSMADWCGLLPQDLYRKALQTGHLDGAIAAGIGAGDPKALFLRAMDTTMRIPDLQAAIKDGVEFDLDRATRSGLAIAATLWDELANRRALPPRLDMLEAAARDGHVLSQAKLAVLGVERGDVARGVDALDALRARDPTGSASYLLSRVYAGDVSPQARVDLDTSLALTREAARKGYLPAIDRLFALQQDGALALGPDETKALMERLRAVGREEGFWWEFSRLLATGTPDDDRAALALVRVMMAKFPKGDAAWQFAELAARGIGGPVPAAELARALDQAIRAQSPQARTLRGELRMGLWKGPDNLPLLPIDPEGALADLQASLDLTGDPRALLLLARYHLLGVGGAPDLQAALAFLHRITDAPDGAAPRGLDPDAAGLAEVKRDAQNLEAALDRMTALADSHSPADIDLGDSGAPVTVTILFDPRCPGCAENGQGSAGLDEIVRWLRATYVRHGFARLELRPVVPGAGAALAFGAFGCSLRDGQDDGALGAMFAPADPARMAEAGAGVEAGAGRDTPCENPVDAALLAARNDDRQALLLSGVFTRDDALAPVDLPDMVRDNAAPPRHRGLPAVVVNGWILSALDRKSLEITIYRLLSPARQVRVRAEGARSCAGTATTAAVPATQAGPETQNPPARTGGDADPGLICAPP